MRLIDADELIEHLRKDPLFEFVERYGIVGVIESRPTVEPETLEEEKHIEMLGREYVAQDIENSKGFIVGHFIREPIVRCKDCIYWQDNNGGYINDWCKWRTDETPDPEDYCSCGDRKQDKEDEQ